MIANTTTRAQQIAEWCGYQLALHPRLRHVLTFWLTTHVLALWSIAAAPPAFASTMAGALNWTGITDSYGVPIGSYYLSVVSTREAITEAGPDLSLNPTSWFRWAGNALTQSLTHDSVATALQAQASIYIVMITLSLWLLRFAMSSTWLYWLATWFRPLFEVLRNLLVELYVFPICLVLGIGVGAYYLIGQGRRGSGWGIMLSAFMIGIIGMVLTKDPLSELYSDNGLLNQGRNLGFTVAQGAMNNGAIAPGGTQGQLSHLTAGIADATIRMPLQLWNFGSPIDSLGSCGSAYSQALLTGQPSGPAHAMGPTSEGGCGAPQALSFAQHLDGSNIGIGILFWVLGLCLTIFICYVTYSYIMVCGAAFLNAIMALFAAGPAMIKGTPRRRAMRRLREFFKHAFLVFVYVVYISFAAVILLKIAAPGGYGAQVHMTHPVALLVLIALMSIVATGLFWWLKKELGDHTRQDLTHAVRNLVHNVRSGYDRGQRGIDRGRDLFDRGRQRFSRNSEDDDGDDSDQPLTGDPIPGRPSGGRPGGRKRPRGSQSRPASATPGSSPKPTGPATTTAPATGRAAAGVGGEAATAGGAATAAEAGAAVVAPEVVAGVAAASEVKRRTGGHHRGSNQQHNGQRPSHGNGGRSNHRPAPDSGQPPARGRASNPSTGHSARSYPPEPNADPRGPFSQPYGPFDQPYGGPFDQPYGEGPFDPDPYGDGPFDPDPGRPHR
ncbi:DUF3824 domain-containing protein [Mycobacterium sp. 29Ha]|uniref:DUF3824 domain-containing protein n=1 Tax=Mycobacterium sp. 29Ha TaxID=2939268 RepID=UPI0029390F19|nr:DUF3824 domain-containing protein [Mycobacterium sp. 29Ha]MDV3133321.1 DUF3824 domain-containing protein [Mycobacterium sp. 29Ha]